jgi:cell wall assembly regulator SMI1
VTFPPSIPPSYFCREEELFKRDRAKLVAEGVSEQEIDEHQRAIEDAILPNPFLAPWSVPLDDDPHGNRAAISSATPSEPNALRIVFRVKGEAIELWRVRKRDE